MMISNSSFEGKSLLSMKEIMSMTKSKKLKARKV